ncbi:hypothetical protein NHF50_10920 [Flavobacterium sp. NRK F10]|nr:MULTISPECIES: hypothetical protein [Flavobacterium]MCO6175553.1 hypothetical protein [Flavobacterium sp. NRK F10]
MKIILLTPMDIEKQKVQQAFAQFSTLKNDYNVVISGIGRENTAKALMNLPEHDLCVLLGFGAVIGQENVLPKQLRLGKPVEITACSLYGYQGELFENGRLIVESARTNLPCLTSLTSDKFVKTTHLTTGTIVNMEDYTFMFLKKPQDFIIRIVSDFLPHATEIDFFKEVEQISFYEAIKAIEEVDF